MNNMTYEYEWKMSKAEKLWYIYMPMILTALALVFSFVDFEMKVTTYMEKKEYLGYVELASLWGNPNIVAILGVICLIPCMIIVPKAMLKVRKDGDGLGLMFMPLGLLGIFDVLSTIQNLKDVQIGVTIGIIIFIVSALATFRKTINFVMPACICLMLVSIFLILANFMPYCYFSLKTPATDPDGGLTTYVANNYYVTYFFRDVFLFLAFGILSSRIAKIYNAIDANKANASKLNQVKFSKKK